MYQQAQKEGDVIENPKIENIQQILELEHFTLQILYINALQLQQHVFITEVTDKVMPKNSNNEWK